MSSSGKETSVCRGKSSQLVAKVVEDATPKSTKVATSFWVAVFKSFCEEEGVDINLEACTAIELSDALSRFYVSLRTREGGVYKRSSYLSVRAAIGRYVSKDINGPFERLSNARASGKQLRAEQCPQEE